MLTSKQRATLRGMANGIPSILQIGKGGVGDTLLVQVNDALTARELIKLNVLETAPETPSTFAKQLADATHCEVVQVIGRRITLYRRNQEHPQIELD